jgi:hypothetical protein
MIKRGRGRPRKTAVVPAAASEDDDGAVPPPPTVPPPAPAPDPLVLCVGPAQAGWGEGQGQWCLTCERGSDDVGGIPTDDGTAVAAVCRALRVVFPTQSASITTDNGGTARGARGGGCTLLRPLTPHTRAVADADDARYLCPVPGCAKSFKNPGGLAYHSAHFYHVTVALLQQGNEVRLATPP